MSTTRTMSERMRAFLALAGQVYPREGDTGTYYGGPSDDKLRAIRALSAGIDAEFSDDHERTVEVLRVSARGHVIWTRFLHHEGQRRYGEGMLRHRWLRDGAHVYYSTGSHAPIGGVYFRVNKR